jgi:hypothetical protein
MKRYEALETLFSKVGLSFAQRVLSEPFYQVGSPGRPPRNPPGALKLVLVEGKCLPDKPYKRIRSALDYEI